MKTSNWLAKIFDWNREVIESAETPFAKLAIFILPILSPIVPAGMTGLHVYKLMEVIFNFGEWSYSIWVTGAILVGVVLELLGYVGAISFIKAVYRWVKFPNWPHFIRAVGDGFSYIFYLLAMVLINFFLGNYFGTPGIINTIVGLLSFITVPTGLLAANHLSEKMEAEEGANLRKEQEDREARKRADEQDFKLKKQALKKGINIFGVQDEQKPTKDRKQKHASDFKEQIPVMLQNEYNKNGRIMELTEITAKLKLDHGSNKGFVSTERTKWMAQNGIEKPSKPMGF